MLGKSTARQTPLEEFPNYMRKKFIGKRWQHPRFARFLQTLFLSKQVSWLLSKTQSANIWGLDFFFPLTSLNVFLFHDFFLVITWERKRNISEKRKGRERNGGGREEGKWRIFRGKLTSVLQAPSCSRGCRQGMGRELWPLALRQCSISSWTEAHETCDDEGAGSPFYVFVHVLAAKTWCFPLSSYTKAKKNNCYRFL